MSFLARLGAAQPFETWPQMKQAAEQRYWDGLTLALGGPGTETGALYLLGYVAGILLKTAYFQVIGILPGDNIAPHLKNAHRDARWRGGNLHTVSSWFYLLSDVRFYQKIAWNPVLAASVQRHVITVSSHWRETLRYTDFAPSGAELEETLASVDWLLENYDVLWR